MLLAGGDSDTENGTPMLEGLGKASSAMAIVCARNNCVFVYGTRRLADGR